MLPPMKQLRSQAVPAPSAQRDRLSTFLDRVSTSSQEGKLSDTLSMDYDAFALLIATPSYAALQSHGEGELSNGHTFDFLFDLGLEQRRSSLLSETSSFLVFKNESQGSSASCLPYLASPDLSDATPESSLSSSASFTVLLDAFNDAPEWYQSLLHGTLSPPSSQEDTPALLHGDECLVTPLPCQQDGLGLIDSLSTACMSLGSLHILDQLDEIASAVRHLAIPRPPTRLLDDIDTVFSSEPVPISRSSSLTYVTAPDDASEHSATHEDPRSNLSSPLLDSHETHLPAYANIAAHPKLARTLGLCVLTPPRNGTAQEDQDTPRTSIESSLEINSMRIRSMTEPSTPRAKRTTKSLKSKSSKEFKTPRASKIRGLFRPALRRSTTPHPCPSSPPPSAEGTPRARAVPTSRVSMGSGRPSRDLDPSRRRDADRFGYHAGPEDSLALSFLPI